MKAKWYLYALADRDLGDLPGGIGGRPVRRWMRDDVHIIISEFGSDPLPLPGREELLAHERVVEAAMEQATVLPFRFGTVADELACIAFCNRNAGRIRQRLARVAGHVEVTLKVLESVAQSTPAGPLVGAAYLQQRQAQAHNEEERQRRAGVLVAEIEHALGPWAQARHHRLAYLPHVLATVTHLIPRAAVKPWAAAAAQLKARYPALDMLASGPWPPYHFSEVTADEFE